MIMQLNAQNQLTIPESLLQTIAPTAYFEAAVENGRITLTPIYLENKAQPEASIPGLGHEVIADEMDWAKASHNFIR